jgi:hypothetical protein
VAAGADVETGGMTMANGKRVAVAVGDRGLVRSGRGSAGGGLDRGCGLLRGGQGGLCLRRDMGASKIGELGGEQREAGRGASWSEEGQTSGRGREGTTTNEAARRPAADEHSGGP